MMWLNNLLNSTFSVYQQYSNWRQFNKISNAVRLGEFIMKKFFVLFLSVTMLFSIYASSVAQNSDGLQLVSSKATSDNNFRYITGVVKNTGSQTYDTVYITFNLYDSSGSIVGNEIDTIHNFRPGATWRFKIMITEEAAVRFEFYSLSGD